MQLSPPEHDEQIAEIVGRLQQRYPGKQNSGDLTVDVLEVAAGPGRGGVGPDERRQCVPNACRG